MKQNEFDVRLEKMRKMKEERGNPYPYRYDISHNIKELKDLFEILKRKEEIVSIAGRIMAKRGHGKAAFFDIMDMHGKIQCYIRKDVVGEKYNIFKKFVDIGDFVGIKGKCFVTKMGEKSILVEDIDILSKSLRPLPEKFHGLQDKEKRYRKRYLDLIMNRDSLDVFKKRSLMIKLIRNFLDEKGFMEVETPVLQANYGGAFAKPFITHYNALNADFYLRISNELYLKRLIIGGIDKVYEFAKDFRNEGMDKTHNPEFTQVEIYQSYVDYNDMMNLTEELFRYIAVNIYGKERVVFGEYEIDFSKKWERVPFFAGIEKETGYDFQGKSFEEIKEIAKKLDIDTEGIKNYGKLLDEIFSVFVQPKLIQPSFIIDHPIELTPLAKRHRNKEGLVERFEPIIAGMEIGNAYSELNDPVDQRERFEHQQKMREGGDLEAEGMDEDFMEAMEYGMPPTGGLGLGVDRMAMIFTNSDSIRDVILFPQLRPQKHNTKELEEDEE